MPVHRVIREGTFQVLLDVVAIRLVVIMTGLYDRINRESQDYTLLASLTHVALRLDFATRRHICDARRV
jgi:hypothetical protein